MPRHRHDPDAVMRPVASGPLAQLSTPALAARYGDAAGHVARYGHELGALRRLDAQARALDQKAARWRRRALGGFGERRAEALDREAQRLDSRRLTLEMRAEAEHRDAVFDVGDRRAPTFRALVEAARALAAGRVWDVVATGDPTHIKAAAGLRMARRPSRVTVGRLVTLRPDLDTVRLVNANGPDLWLYPALLALGHEAALSPALVALGEIDLDAGAVRFVEEGPLPPGAHVVEQTWRFVNQDETPDRRFSDNPKRDVALYGRLSFRSARGLHEAFLTSDAPAALAFGEAFRAHQAAVADGARQSGLAGP